MSKYLSKLTDKQIAEFFYSIGIQPYFAIDDNNNILPPIIDGENSKIFKGVVELSDDEKREAQLEKLLTQKLASAFPGFKNSFFNKTQDGKKIVLIKMSDYCAYVLDVSDNITELDKKINKNYVNFMADTFDSYADDYEKYIQSLDEEYER